MQQEALVLQQLEEDIAATLKVFQLLVDKLMLLLVIMDQL